MYPNTNQSIAHQMFEASVALMDDKMEQLIRDRGEMDLNSPRQHGRSLLTLSCSISSVRIVQLLLENGADPNAADDDHDTALECAVWSERPDLLPLLFKHGADPDMVGNSGTNIIEIAEDRAPECLEYLRKFIALRDAEKLDGATPKVGRKSRKARL